MLLVFLVIFSRLEVIPRIITFFIISIIGDSRDIFFKIFKSYFYISYIISSSRYIKIGVFFPSLIRGFDIFPLVKI